MKFREFITEDKFANLSNLDILLKISNGKSNENVKGIKLSPKRSKDIYDFVDEYLKKDEDMLNKKSFKDFINHIEKIIKKL